MITILCVDDDPDELEIFCEAVRDISQSAMCIPALDGEEALHIMSMIVPDLIFLDVNMPRMNGQECLYEIKKNQRLKNIPVIIYSTSANPKEVRVFNALGVHRYLKKHSNYETLCTELKEIIESNPR